MYMDPSVIITFVLYSLVCFSGVYTHFALPNTCCLDTIHLHFRTVDSIIPNTDRNKKLMDVTLPGTFRSHNLDAKYRTLFAFST